MHHVINGILFLLALGLAGCLGEPEAPALFERLEPAATGVAFVNHLPEEPDFNILNYLYYYNGGGVAAGDVNGDGLVDLYFTSNLDSNRLYLNRGGLQFEDVTAQAGVAGAGNWTTGVTMADVDGDGDLDIYVIGVDGYLDRNSRNLLYVNSGDPGMPGQAPTFEERAADFGLDFRGYGTHAAFFDYDGDGDLDAYLLNHSTHHEDTYGPAERGRQRHERAGDRLYRNDDGYFVEVSQEAGIYSGVSGYGLGLAVSDLDGDGCPDVYVANDFHEDDFLYYNDCDGTFTEALRGSMGHTSLASMGVDAADVDNDGRTDVTVLDMLPEEEAILKASFSADGNDVYRIKRRYGYHHQLTRNTLQLNRGLRRFSEVGAMAGVAATDWSWAVLLADLDNDGWRDIFVSNGIYRRPNDLDYIHHISNQAIQASLERGITEANMTLFDHMPQVAIPNYAFRNRGGVTFEDASAAWGLGQPGFSNGAVYADLDGDGDLDLITNDINAPASIYRNRTDELHPERHHLTITLAGEPPNTYGVGAKVTLRHDSGQVIAEQMPTRGFQSSVEPRLHIGLGRSTTVDTLTVAWPDGRVQTLTDVPADQPLTLRQVDATGSFSQPQPSAPLFADVTQQVELPYRHEENSFVDFNREVLMPHKLSTQGPALAVGDVNGDGLDDVFAGGAKRQPAALMLQHLDGRFARSTQPALGADSLHEDVDAAFFDADGDGDLDLYVVSGGNEFWGESDALRDRLYLNDGTGRLTRSATALPDAFANGACVVPADYDRDGDVDLFVGSRVVAKRYGDTPRSILLQNDGAGRFSDVTDAVAPGLAVAGMVTSAAWTDTDGDGALDLVVAGEWMPVSTFVQREGRLVDHTEAAGLTGTTGWWNRIAAADLDGDGDDDLVAGNYGLNTLVQAGRESPVRLYLDDYDANGSLDAVLARSRDGAYYPFHTVDELYRQVTPLRKRFDSYADFGARTIDDLFPVAEHEDTEVLQARLLASSVFLNEGDGTFSIEALPAEAQVAPVYAIRVDDYDSDGALDLLLAGNLFDVPPAFGRYDGLYGVLLRGDGTGGFTTMDLAETGLLLNGQVRRLRPLRVADGRRVLLAARNGDRIQVLHPPMTPPTIAHARPRRLP